MAMGARFVFLKMLNIKAILFWLSPIVYGVIISILRGYDWIYLVFCVLIRILYSAVGRVDYENHIVPNRLLISLIVIESSWLIISRDYEMLKNSFSGLFFVVGAELAIYLVSLVAKRDEMVGFGDYKYLLILGYSCGINNLFAVFFCSLEVALLMFMSKGFCTKRFNIKERIAIAPYLSIGAILFG